jgi:hypothetical protein
MLGYQSQYLGDGGAALELNSIIRYSVPEIFEEGK